MKLLTEWLAWWEEGRKEHKFHCDLLLAPGEWVAIDDSSGHIQTIGSAEKFTKVHLAASWEHRSTEFIE